MKKQIIIIGLIAICLCGGCGSQSNVISLNKEFAQLNDRCIVENLQSTINYNIQKKNKENLEQQKIENKELNPVQEEPIVQEDTAIIVESYDSYVEYNYDYQDDYSYNNDYIVSSGLTPQSGVNYHDGRTETYYSSNVLYHQDTGNWSVDDEGFYRTDNGYYVVAASDMPQGSTFEGSKGTCIVLDSGCDEGVTDYYVAW